MPHDPNSKPVVLQAGETAQIPGTQVVIRVEPPRPPRRRIAWLPWSLLVASVALNYWLLTDSDEYSPPRIPTQHVSGTPDAADRIAIISVAGTISPPFTERWIRELKAATDDETVKGVVIEIDSPGGFVADSHQIYREIQKLVEKKPVSVSMKRLAASGGYYIAMGIGPSGKIYAEPTTWTGSIGVIVPRYNAAELARTAGVKVEPLVTGPLKDSLNPFRDFTDAEKKVWDAILEDSFGRFIGVIDAGRGQLDVPAIRALATGQIYTAQQALDLHLVDQIGYSEDAVTELAQSLQLTDYEAFRYRQTPGLVDALLGAQIDARPTLAEQLLDSSVPRAMYYCSWSPWIQQN